MQLAAEASLASIRDAGFSPNEVDGTVTFSMDTNDELALIRSLGVPMLRFADLALDLDLLDAAREAAELLLRDEPEVAKAHLARWLGGRNEYLKV